jgi:hypothetical protein
MSIARALDYAIRAAGLGALVLGLLFWSGHFYEFLHVHAGLGALVVVALWALAAMCFRKRAASVGLITTAVLWGLVTLLLGIEQTGILVGDYHAMVQIAHLLIGLGSIAFGAVLSKSLIRSA